MKHVKNRFEGINGLSANYYWYSSNGKKDKKRGIEEMENWLANLIPVLDGEETLIRASTLEVFIYKVWTKSIKKWQALSVGNKIALSGFTLSIVSLIVDIVLRIIPLS